MSKHAKRIAIACGIAFALAAGGSSANIEYCDWCWRQYVACERNGGDPDACYTNYENCMLWNGCWTP
jgi:hypothetical protein